MYPTLGSPTWPPDLRKRLRAARGYAGLSLDELASKTALGRQTIFRMESGERGHDRIREMELREIARVCGLPYGFFTADFSVLETEPENVGELRPDELVDAVDALAELLLSSRDADRDETLRRWQAHRQQRSEGTSPESRSREGG